MTNETCPCPKCNAPSPLYDCVEVDIGVGVLRGEEQWACPTHGVWGLSFGPPYELVFQEDQPFVPADDAFEFEGTFKV